MSNPIFPAITDHALLRWMERVHGIDVEGWRELMRQELAASLDAYEGEHNLSTEAFVITADNRVVTVLRAGRPPSPHKPSVAVPRVV